VTSSSRYASICDFRSAIFCVATTQEGRTELVAAGFDAGLHLGESIQRDMVAVRVSLDQSRRQQPAALSALIESLRL
jgi:hypothetical protein